ncbi:MAG: hypothetical protein ACTSVF_01020 [Candidatus Asgardarchaeia archaeon]
MSVRSSGSIPDEVLFLCLLHNIGATTPEKSLSLEEISKWILMNSEEIEQNLKKLIESEYIQPVSISGSERYYVTINGIRKVLSMYS